MQSQPARRSFPRGSIFGSTPKWDVPLSTMPLQVPSVHTSSALPATRTALMLTSHSSHPAKTKGYVPQYSPHTNYY
eukprot:6488474-Amphidinium_carterae.1